MKFTFTPLTWLQVTMLGIGIKEKILEVYLIPFTWFFPNNHERASLLLLPQTSVLLLYINMTIPRHSLLCFFFYQQHSTIYLLQLTKPLVILIIFGWYWTGCLVFLTTFTVSLSWRFLGSSPLKVSCSQRKSRYSCIFLNMWHDFDIWTCTKFKSLLSP